MRPHVLFDLDGTLTDSAPGITRCLAHAVAAVEGSPQDAASLRSHIGSPLKEIFASLLPGASEARVDEAVRAYAARFDEVGIFENAVFPGIMDALDRLREAGCQLYVATAKRQPVAERVIDHFALGTRFRAVIGTDFGRGIRSKEDVLRHGLAEFDVCEADAAMVGDRSHDIEAARALDIPVVGVGWGYGSPDELARADAIADAPEDLSRALREAARRRSG